MITLAIDTSTPRGSVALLHDEQPVVELTFERGGLFPALQKLAPGKIDMIVVGVGPGSFTGIRAGIAAAKGLALPGKLPIKAVSSFDAIALSALPQLPADCGQMCVLCDARRDEIYSTLYDLDGHPTRACRISRLESIADEIHDPVWFVSAEIEKYRDALREIFGGFASVCEMPVFPRAAMLRPANLPLEPIYLRLPEYKKL